PFTEFLEARFEALSSDVQCRVRRQLARGLGRFLANLHDNGIAHPDPHAGNLLVEIEMEQGANAPRSPIHFSLLDVHAVRFGPPLSWAESRENLILYNRWFQLRASAADRFRFWREYRASRQSLSIPDADKEAADLERATRASNRQFWMA